MISEGDHPEEFGKCCILADPFHPPSSRFTEKFIYNGLTPVGPENYHEFMVNVPNAGGVFKHFVKENESESNG